MKRISDTLTLPLLALLLTLVAAIAMVRFTQARADDARRNLDAQKTLTRDAQIRVQRSGAEKDLIVRYLPDYQRLDALGFVGNEQRIGWIEALSNANQKVGLFGVGYDISARKAFPHAAALGAGQMNIMQSVMKLRLQLLHEEDLLNFLAHVAEQNVGVFIVNHCSLRRAAAMQTAHAQPQLAAECELAWLTAQAPPPSEAR